MNIKELKLKILDLLVKDEFKVKGVDSKTIRLETISKSYVIELAYYNERKTLSWLHVAYYDDDAKDNILSHGTTQSMLVNNENRIDRSICSKIYDISSDSGYVNDDIEKSFNVNVTTKTIHVDELNRIPLRLFLLPDGTTREYRGHNYKYTIFIVVESDVPYTEEEKSTVQGYSYVDYDNILSHIHKYEYSDIMKFNSNTYTIIPRIEIIGDDDDDSIVKIID